MNIEINNITKEYGNKKILQDVSFDIDSGTICGLLGVNGTGKSTLMKILFGLVSADKGTILFDGKENSKDDRSIGALIESPAIYMNLSAFDNLKTKALLYGVSDKKINETLKIVGLTSAGRKRAEKFSLGMKQRLGIAMAILTDPKFLILDEPTNGLDPDGVLELLELIKKLKSAGVTILISSHQLHEIKKISDRIVILDKGRIRYDQQNDSTVNIEKLFFNVVHGDM